MSESINCPSCGAVNLLPVGKNSMYCAFCGSSIDKPITDSTPLESAIKSKPLITEKKVKITPGKPNTAFWSETSLTAEKRRVDGGFEYWTGREWYFVKDEAYVTSEGGELSLTNRGIKSLNEIIYWFSDNELLEVKKLILNDNNIDDLSGIERFENLELLNLSNNNISELPNNNEFLSKIFKIYIGGNPVEDKISKEQFNYYSNIRLYTPRFKKVLTIPNVVGKIELNYKNFGIESLDEVIDLYTDADLLRIEIINFSTNKLKTLAGLSKFYSTEIDFSNNDLTLIDDLPKFKKKYSEDLTSLNLEFTNNKNLKGFTDQAISHFYDIRLSDVTIYLRGCDNFNYESLNKINFHQIFKKANYEFTRFMIYVDSNVELPKILKQIGFVEENSHWGLGYGYKKSGCFIATATMGSYDHPEVMELRNFRDNWILEKKWGEGFVAWYYHYGEVVAKSIEKSFVLKKISYLFIVKPLVFLTRFLKRHSI